MIQTLRSWKCDKDSRTTGVDAKARSLSVLVPQIFHLPSSLLGLRIGVPVRGSLAR